MEGYDFEQIELPAKEAVRAQQRFQACSPGTPVMLTEPLRLFKHRKTKLLGNCQFQRIRLDCIQKQRVGKSVVTRQATVEELRLHYLDSENLPLSVNLVVRVAGQDIPLSLLKELYTFVQYRIEERQLGMAPFEDYLDVIEELKRHSQSFGQASHVELMELIKQKVQMLEQLRIYRQGPSRQEIDIMDEYRTEMKRKEQQERRLNSPNYGLLDCLTTDSIFEQAATITLLKKQSGLSCYSQKTIGSGKELKDKKLGRRSTCNGKEGPFQSFDEARLEKYLQRQQTHHGQKTIFLREMLGWHRELKRILYGTK